MERRRRTAVLVAVMLGLCPSGCKRSTTDQKETSHQSHEEPADTASAKASADIVQIDPEMLRDLRITTTEAEARPAGEGMTALGELGVNEDRYAEVGSPIAARVVKVIASAGDTVRPGQALAELQSVELGRVRAEVLSAQARGTLADQALERKRSLGAQGIASASDVQTAEAEAVSSKAQLQAARAALDALGAPGGRGGGFIVSTPIAGTVLERTAVLGQIIDATEPPPPLFRIADLSKLWLTVHAYERDAVRVQVGAAARVIFPALPGRTLTGAVAFVGRRVEPTSRTIPIRVELANPDGLLRPGMSASAWVALGDTEGSIVTVPAAALQRLRQGWCVFLPRDNGAFELRVVGRGRDLRGEVEILSSLRARETVVVDGAFLLKAEAEKSSGEGDHHEH